MSEDRRQNLPGGDLGEVLSILRSIDTRLTALEDKVERRLQDTPPIWEQVLVRLTAVEERLTKVEDRLEKVETRLGKVEDEFFWFGRNFRNWTHDLMKLQEKYEDLEERIGQTGSDPSS
jgi:DNA repair ATPase RecN